MGRRFHLTSCGEKFNPVVSLKVYFNGLCTENVLSDHFESSKEGEGGESAHSWTITDQYRV